MSSVSLAHHVSLQNMTLWLLGCHGILIEPNFTFLTLILLMLAYLKMLFILPSTRTACSAGCLKNK